MRKQVISEGTRVWIWSCDETPSCGSGIRHVTTHPRPRNRVRLKPVANPDSNGDLVSLATFRKILYTRDS